MSKKEFESDLKDVVDKHSTGLGPEDLEDAADTFDALADRWRDNAEVWG